MNDDLLPELDTEFLRLKAYDYEIIPHGGIIHLIIKNFPIPVDHYDVSQADVLIEFPVGYPNAPLDMFWFYPVIKLNNGNAPKTTEHHAEYHGKLWQRWSRHGTWRPGIDSIKNFIQSIHVELKKGI